MHALLHPYELVDSKHVHTKAQFISCETCSLGGGLEMLQEGIRKTDKRYLTSF